MIVAGTGHRPNKLGGYSQRVTDEWVDLAVYTLELWRPEKVISGLALGWAVIYPGLMFSDYVVSL